MGTVPTMRVKHPDGFVTINETDFDATIHERFEQSEEPAPGAADESASTGEATTEEEAASTTATQTRARKR